MARTKHKAKKRSVREVLRVRPKRGRVDLDAIDPSKTNGVKRRQAEAGMLAD